MVEQPYKLSKGAQKAAGSGAVAALVSQAIVLYLQSKGVEISMDDQTLLGIVSFVITGSGKLWNNWRKNRGR